MWTVHLPGLGNAWVSRDDVVSVHDVESTDSRDSAISYDTINISVLTEESEESTLSLLNIIGRDTKRIELYEYCADCGVDNWVSRVLECCPNLEELRSRLSEFDTMKICVDAAEARHCRLRQLLVLSADPSHHDTFFDTLCDPSDPLTTHLRDLYVKFCVDTKSEFDSIVESAQRMLELNRRLYKVELGFQLASDVQSCEKQLEAAFAAYADEKVSIRVGALDLRSKAAFLSAVHGSTNPQSRLHDFDSRVISTIFQFATQSRTRLLKLKILM